MLLTAHTDEVETQLLDEYWDQRHLLSARVRVDKATGMTVIFVEVNGEVDLPEEYHGLPLQLDHGGAVFTSAVLYEPVAAP